MIYQIWSIIKNQICWKSKFCVYDANSKWFKISMYNMSYIINFLQNNMYNVLFLSKIDNLSNVSNLQTKDHYIYLKFYKNFSKF